VTDQPPNTDPTVIDLVDQLEELVSTGRRVPFTSGVVVNEDEVLELIDRTRLGLPDELMQARHLLEDQRRVLVEAEQEAERILSRAETEVARILSRAEAEAGRVVDEASARAAVMVGDHAIAEQAREHAATVLAEAEERAAKTCSEADAYAREVMVRLEDQLMRAATTVRKGIDALPAEGGSRRKRRERE
jgi:vacuolar-type H+-ATPase subunit H